MATKTTKRKGETSTTVAVGIRIDPKIKFALDVMGRLQKRSLTAVIEWAVSKAITEYQIEGASLGDKINEIWSTDEVVRITRLVTKLPQAATYDEMRIWDTIRNSPDFWDDRDRLDETALHKNWRALLAHVEEAKHWSTAEPFVIPVARSEIYDGDDSHGDAATELSDSINQLTGRG